MAARHYILVLRPRSGYISFVMVGIPSIVSTDWAARVADLAMLNGCRTYAVSAKDIAGCDPGLFRIQQRNAAGMETGKPQTKRNSGPEIDCTTNN